MIRLQKIIIVCLLMITLTGCGSDNALSTEDKIEDIFTSAYIAKCRTAVKSNKTENTYNYECKMLDDGTYIIDYGDLVITVGEGSANLSGPSGDINASVQDVDMALIPTYFFESYLKSGKLTEVENGYLLLCDISQSSPYRATAKMELDKKCIPLKMIIEDIDGNAVISMNIQEFKQMK